MTLYLSGDIKNCGAHGGRWCASCGDCKAVNPGAATSANDEIVVTGHVHTPFSPPEIFVWKCFMCGHRTMTNVDFHVNDRPICVECNAEMAQVMADPDLREDMAAIWEQIVPGAQV